jgi:hypothetical protein
MQSDTATYDSIVNRPLPRWLTDQKLGITAVKPQKITMREDNSLRNSFLLTTGIVVVLVVLMTILFLKKHNRRA